MAELLSGKPSSDFHLRLFVKGQEAALASCIQNEELALSGQINFQTLEMYFFLLANEGLFKKQSSNSIKTKVL